jgi:putative DNA methylase
MSDNTKSRPSVFIEKMMPVQVLNEQVNFEHGGNPFKGLHRWYSRKPLSFSRASVLASLLPADITMQEFEYLLGLVPGKEVKLYKTPPNSVQIKKVQDYCEKVWGTRTPTVLDAFAGGGSIPFEAARYGLNVLASDLNPVAVVTMKAAMEYPLKFGPDLQQDIDKWVKWVGDEAEKRLAEFFPCEPGETTQYYFWAHTVVCPSCKSVVPLSPNWWLYKRPEKQNIHKWCAVKPIPNLENKRVDFELLKGKKGKNTTIENDDWEYDPETTTTLSRGVGRCLNCGNVIENYSIKSQGSSSNLGHQLYAVAYKECLSGLQFRIPTDLDLEAIEKSKHYLSKKWEYWTTMGILPDVSLQYAHETHERQSLPEYGLKNWSDFFNHRQLLTLVIYVEIINEAKEVLLAEYETEKAKAILSYLAFVFG